MFSRAEFRRHRDRQRSHHERGSDGAQSGCDFLALPAARHSRPRLFVRRSLRLAKRRRLYRYSIGDLAQPALHLLDGDRAQTVTRARESRAVLAALAIALATSCAGCFGASAITLAPAAAAGAAQLLGAQVAMRQSQGGISGTADEAE